MHSSAYYSQFFKTGNLKTLLPWLPSLVTITIRLVCLTFFVSSPFFLPMGSDRGIYHQVAMEIAQGKTITEIFTFMPLYPYLLGFIYKLLGGPNLVAIAILQALLDGLTARLIFGMTQRRYGTTAGLLAGSGFALLGIAAVYSLVTMSVSLGLFWVALLAVLSDSWRTRWNIARAAIFGLLLGIGGQIAGAFWIMLIPFTFWIMLSNPKTSWTSRAARGLAVIVFAGICVFPSFLHNTRYSQRHVPVSAHFGLNCYMGNNEACNGYGTAIPGLTTSAKEMIRDSRLLASRLSGRPLAWDQANAFWLKQALNFWLQKPGKACLLLLRKAHRMISLRDFDDTGLCRLLPEVVPALQLAFLSFGIIWITACFGFGLRRPAENNTGLYIIALGQSLSMLITFVTARYRLPLAVILLPFAAGTLTSLPLLFKGWHRLKTIPFGIGILGIAICVFPHSQPDTTLVDDLNRSIHWCQYGDREQAMVFAKRATAGYPSSPEAWFALGNAYMLVNDYHQAINAFRCALAIRPDRTDILFNTATALERLGETENALTLYAEIVRLNPQNAKAWFALAVLYSKAGQLEKAEKALNKAAGIVGWDHPEIIDFLKDNSSNAN